MATRKSQITEKYSKKRKKQPTESQKNTKTKI